MILVAIKDRKAEIFGQIYTSKNEAVAVREFSEACQNKDSNLNKFPEDFEFYKVGDYDENTGVIIQPEIEIEKENQKIKIFQPKKIAEATLFVEKGEQK